MDLLKTYLNSEESRVPWETNISEGLHVGVEGGETKVDDIGLHSDLKLLFNGFIGI